MFLTIIYSLNIYNIFFYIFVLYFFITFKHYYVWVKENLGGCFKDFYRKKSFSWEVIFLNTKIKMSPSVDKGRILSWIVHGAVRHKVCPYGGSPCWSGDLWSPLEGSPYRGRPYASLHRFWPRVSGGPHSRATATHLNLQSLKICSLLVDRINF